MGLLLLVVGGGIGGAMAGAHLAQGSGAVYLLGPTGAILGAGIVGLAVVFIGIPLLVMEAAYDDRPSRRIEELQQKAQLRPNDCEILVSLGDALQAGCRLGEAGDAYEKAIRLRTDDPQLYVKLGNTRERIGRHDEAIQAYQEAVRLDKESSDAHLKLALLLRVRGRLEEAIVEYREVARLENGNPHAHYNLGIALRDTGQFDEAIAALRDANRIFAARSHRDPLSDDALRETEAMAKAADHLPAVLEGKDRPADAAECLVFAQLCQLPYLKQYAAAARFFDDAFARQPDLAEDLQKRHRYCAASLAARAGCGQSGDAAGLDEHKRARLRRQALEWLWADLNAWGRLLNMARNKASTANNVTRALQRWLEDPDFACVRESEALARLPEAERQPWHDLWRQVWLRR